MRHCAESETELYLRAEVWGANGPAPALVHVTEVRGAAAASPVIGPSSPVETRTPTCVGNALRCSVRIPGLGLAS